MGKQDLGQWQAMRDEVLHHPEWSNDFINEVLGIIDCYMPDIDPTPYCHVCGAMQQRDCSCPSPFYAENH